MTTVGPRPSAASAWSATWPGSMSGTRPRGRDAAKPGVRVAPARAASTSTPSLAQLAPEPLGQHDVEGLGGGVGGEPGVALAAGHRGHEEEAAAAAPRHGAAQRVGQQQRSPAVDVEHGELRLERLVEEGTDGRGGGVVDQQPHLGARHQRGHHLEQVGAAEVAGGGPHLDAVRARAARRPAGRARRRGGPAGSGGARGRRGGGRRPRPARPRRRPPAPTGRSARRNGLTPPP